MPINFIPNDPSAAGSAPAIRVQPKRPNRPAGRAGFTFSSTVPEGTFAPGTPRFLFWQCREGALAAVDAWESVAGNLRCEVTIGAQTGEESPQARSAPKER